MIFTGDWSLPVKEAEAANSLIDQGVDVLTMHVDSPKVIVETAERRGIFVCGYHANQAALAPKGYLTGAEWNWGKVYTDYVKRCRPASSHEHLLRGGLKEGFVKTSPYGKAVSADAKKKADAVKAKMMDGTFVIFKGPLKDNTGKVVIAAGTEQKQTDVGAREDELPGRGRGRQDALTPASELRERWTAASATAAAAGVADDALAPGARARARAIVDRRVAALAAAMVLFGVFMALAGQNPLAVYAHMYRGAFGAWFSLQNTLQRAAPLMLTALCDRAARAPRADGHRRRGRDGAGRPRGRGAWRSAAGTPPSVMLAAMVLAGMRRRRRLDRARRRAAPATAASTRPSARLLLHYIAHRAVQSSGRRPAARSGEPEQAFDACRSATTNMLGNLPGLDVHWGLVFGLVACLRRLRARCSTPRSASARASSAAMCARRCWRACRSRRLIVDRAFLGGAAAGLAGAVEVAAVHGTRQRVADRRLRLRGHPGGVHRARRTRSAIIPVAMLLGGIGASGGLLQRRLDLPDAAVIVLQGIAVPGDPRQRDALRPALRFARAEGGRRERRSAGVGRAARVLGGAIRVSTPFLFVSLGECLTEKSGRINLGLEGTLVMGAMSRLRRLVPDAARPGSACWRRACGVVLGALHALAVQPPARQRHRGRHRADAVRHRARVLPGQAADPAHGAAPAGDLRSAGGATSPQVRRRCRSTRCS